MQQVYLLRGYKSNCLQLRYFYLWFSLLMLESNLNPMRVYFSILEELQIWHPWVGVRRFSRYPMTWMTDKLHRSICTVTVSRSFSWLTFVLHSGCGVYHCNGTLTTAINHPTVRLSLVSVSLPIFTLCDLTSVSNIQALCFPESNIKGSECRAAWPFKKHWVTFMKS